MSETDQLRRYVRGVALNHGEAQAFYRVIDRLEARDTALREALREAAATVHVQHYYSLTVGPLSDCEYGLCVKFRDTLASLSPPHRG